MGQIRALWLDISKTYEKVEWDFLEKVMVRMGFSSGWVAKIMNYVHTIRYVV